MFVINNVLIGWHLWYYMEEKKPQYVLKTSKSRFLCF